MNGNKAARVLSVIFSIIFSALFIRLVFLIVIQGYEHQSIPFTYSCETWQHVIIVLSGVVIACVLAALYFALNRQNADKIHRKITDSGKNTRAVIFCGAAVMLVLQLVCGVLLICQPVSDLNILNIYANSYASTGSFEAIRQSIAAHSNAYDVYMAMYPNNFALLFFWSIIYRASYLLSGGVSPYLPMVVNTLAINASVAFTALLAQKIYGNRRALFTLLLCALFVPFYTYTPYFYTDSVSMPFSIGAIYLLFNALSAEGRRKRYLTAAACGMAMFAGFKLKGSVIILMPCVLLYLFLTLKPKRFACLSLSIILGFGVPLAGYTAVFHAAKLVTAEQSEKYEIPYTHWIMMGLKGVGHYSKSDFSYTYSFETKEEKSQAAIKVIQSRLEGYLSAGEGKDNLLTHFDKKAVWTWEDGTYFISRHIQEPLGEKNFLHSLVLNDGENHFVYYAYCCGFQLFLLVMAAVSGLRGVLRRKLDETLLLKIIIFAVFLFFLIWETRSRYLYNFTPVLILTAADGLDSLRNGVLFLINKLSDKENNHKHYQKTSQI